MTRRVIHSRNVKFFEDRTALIPKDTSPKYTNPFLWLDEGSIPLSLSSGIQVPMLLAPSEELIVLPAPVGGGENILTPTVEQN